MVDTNVLQQMVREHEDLKRRARIEMKKINDLYVERCDMLEEAGEDSDLDSECKRLAMLYGKYMTITGD